MQIQLDKRSPQQPIRLVQLTDSHLGDQVGEQLLGLDTDKSLEMVVQQVLEERGESDVLLATGDIANHASAPAYRRFRQTTQCVAKHALWLPGNHDDWAVMQAVVGSGTEVTRTLIVDNWQIVMLNSAIVGKVGGGFSAEELDFLKQTLEQSSAEHVLLCLHHHPIHIGCDWLDPQQVSNSDEFFDIVDAFPSVRAVVWGHIHQQVDERRNSVKLMATPSTCIQFEAKSQQFALARLNPGYRWLELYRDGRIESSVSRLSGVDFAIDYDSAGY